MSSACDPRNRPGFVSGDLSAHLAEPLSTQSQMPADGLQTVLLAGFTAAMIVAVVFAVVLFAH